jgi:basic amino acid/polyamine antiporter, APA family
VSLSVFDAVIIVVGLVIGIGIFRTPSLVAANVGSELGFIAVWIAGGAITLTGALCYAELSAAHPSTGGEYNFLSRAYGRPLGILFGWARSSVIQTGAIAGVAFVLGDYLAQFVPLGPYGPALYAAIAIVACTALNVIGTAPSKTVQVVMTLIEVATIAAIIAVGLFTAGDGAAPAQPLANPGALGMAMVFVLLTYGGWNEASYLTGELKDPSRNIGKVLVLGIVILTALYVFANVALLAVLGLDGLRASDAVAADMMAAVFGPTGALLISLAIIVAALSTLNATILTGARLYYSVARDLTLLPKVGDWDERGSTPTNGLLLQAAVALVLVAIGAASLEGFQAMVDYTAPVFWSFIFLVGGAVFVLRRREPDRVLPYRVPLYPLTPIVFCLACLYMVHASVAYTGVAALIGLAVLAAGFPLLFFRRRDAPEN